MKKILLLLLMGVQGTSMAQQSPCWNEGASGCASSGAQSINIPLTLHCGDTFVYFINEWCVDLYDLDEFEWEYALDSSEAIIPCLSEGVYTFTIFSYIEGPDPGNSGQGVTCELYEHFTLTVLHSDSTMISETTCEIDSAGTFVAHYISQECSCDSTVVTKRIFVPCDPEEKEEGDVFFPTVFSPNGDGINDYFYPQAGDGVVDQVIEMKIFDRWGNWVWQHNSFPVNDPSQGWAGTFRGDPCEQDVHVYVATVRFRDGNIRQYKGDIMLVR